MNRSRCLALPWAGEPSAAPAKPSPELKLRQIIAPVCPLGQDGLAQCPQTGVHLSGRC